MGVPCRGGWILRVGASKSGGGSSNDHLNVVGGTVVVLPSLHSSRVMSDVAKLTQKNI